MVGCLSLGTIEFDTDSPIEESNCRVIQHAIAQTCVPLNPKRIVVLDTNPLDAALALGVKPVGAPQSGKFLFSEEQTKGIESIGSVGQPNLEKIVSLKPDLILGAYWDQEIYDLLCQIAPTIIPGSVDFEWKEDLKLYARALNKTEVAEELLQNYQERIKTFQLQMGYKLQQTEVSLVRTTSYGAGIPASLYLRNSFMGSVVAETGLPRPAAQRNLPALVTNDHWGLKVSFERLDLIDGDVIFAIDPSFDDSELESTLSNLERHPLWSQLRAVQQGHVYVVSYYIWVTQRNVGGANRILDDLFRYLIKNPKKPYLKP